MNQKYHDFIKAGAKQGTFVVSLSLLATIIGSSATHGVAKMAYDIGFPAFWWLGVGSICLILQSIFLSKKIRLINNNGQSAVSLPDIAKIIVGKYAGMFCAITIAIAWIGVVAAQFSALAQLCNELLPLSNGLNIKIWLAFCIFTIFYIATGGQKSIMRTDVLQTILLFIAILVCVLILADDKSVSFFTHNLNLTNEKFTNLSLANMILLVGGAYFLGPDMVSRNLSSKDADTAKRSSYISGILLAFFAIGIVFIGMWAKNENLQGQNILFIIIKDYLPNWAAILFGIGLICALISSADTCLMSAASILDHDLLGNKFGEPSVKRLRISIILLGLIALIFANYYNDIIKLLLMSYTIYTPGIVIPLSIAILMYKKKKVNQKIWLTAAILGGLCGVINTFKPIEGINFALLGMAISAIVVLFSLEKINEVNHGKSNGIN